MEDSITFISVNCQGMSQLEKRRDVLHFLKDKKYSVYLLQDTHFTEKEHNYIRSLWEYDCFFSSYTSQARGVAILFNNTFEYSLHNIITDHIGNKLILDVTINGRRTTLANIYGPNNDSPDFYKELKSDIEKLNNEYIILAGDFNLVLDPTIDTLNYVNVNNPNSRDEVINLMNEMNVFDAWRELNMEKKDIHMA